MRARWLALFAIAAVVGISACSSSPASGEKVGTSSGPPITLCYEPDGALCPLDAGEDGGDDAAVDAPDAGAPALPDACSSSADC
jgi:hypothetical protein